MKKRQEGISKAAKERLAISQENEASLLREKETLKEMVRLNQELTKTQQKKYNAIVKAEKKEEAIKKKKEKQLKVEKEQVAESQRKDKLDNNHSKNLNKLVQGNRKNQGFAKNMFGLSTKVNSLAKDNVALLNEENKSKSFSSDLSQTLTDASMELASGSLDLLGLKDQEKALQEALTKAVGKTVAVNVDVQKDLIGGMVVTVGSQMIDDSVKRKLERLKIAMKSNANSNAASAKVANEN